MNRFLLWNCNSHSCFLGEWAQHLDLTSKTFKNAKNLARSTRWRLLSEPEQSRGRVMAHRTGTNAPYPTPRRLVVMLETFYLFCPKLKESLVTKLSQFNIKNVIEPVIRPYKCERTNGTRYFATFMSCYCIFPVRHLPSKDGSTRRMSHEC